MKFVKVYLIFFGLFAFLGFACKSGWINLGGPFGWDFGVGAIVTAGEHAPGNLGAKVLGVVTGYAVGEQVAVLFRNHPPPPNFLPPTSPSYKKIGPSILDPYKIDLSTLEKFKFSTPLPSPRPSYKLGSSLWEKFKFSAPLQQYPWETPTPRP